MEDGPNIFGFEYCVFDRGINFADLKWKQVEMCKMTLKISKKKAKKEEDLSSSN